MARAARQAEQQHPPAVGRREGAHCGGAGVLHLRLNPAPFCMLDEVDARWTRPTWPFLRDGAQHVGPGAVRLHHHNKGTMEMSNQLMGVTMNEPGVSRLVAVDVEEAVRIAAM